MDKNVFSKEWMENFKSVFEEEAEIILDNVGNDYVFLNDILYGKLGHLGSLLNLESVNIQIKRGEYEAVANNYRKSLLIGGLIEEVTKVSLDPNRVL